MNDPQLVGNFISSGIMEFVSEILLLVFSLIVLFVLDYKLALAIVGIVGFLMAAIFPISFKLRVLSKAENEGGANLNFTLIETFSNIRFVKSVSGKLFQGRKAEAEVQELKEIGKKTARIISALLPLISVAVSFGLITILVYGEAQA